MKSSNFSSSGGMVSYMAEIDETDNQKTPEATWLSDQDLNFSGINKHLHTLEIALRQGIKESKKELARMINAKNVVK
jgi:hypothetical protein